MQKIAKIELPGVKIHLRNTVMIFSFHIIALAAVYTFSWTNLAVMLVCNWIVGGLGVGLGYHRLLTHRSFVAPKWLEYTLTTLGTLSMQDGPIRWVANHRIHHQNTEEEGDPHSTRRGFWWAHLGWILTGNAQDHSEETLKKYVPDLLGDRYHVWLGKYFFVPLLVSAGILFLIGGLPLVIWGVFVRLVFGWHTTWLVNSAAHIWGRRRFQTADDSTNNWFVALLTFGEGWHNNHHARPSSARHGLRWYEFDLNWQTVRVFRFLGWANRVRLHEDGVSDKMYP